VDLEADVLALGPRHLRRHQVVILGLGDVDGRSHVPRQAGPLADQALAEEIPDQAG
jgi:hypothetical protein